MSTFDRISEKYREKSLVQQKAAAKLFDLLKIGGSDDIIDIACGPGHITNGLSKVTNGKVTGIDISEDLDCNDMFDIAFCNSALQWFDDPDMALAAIFNSLKKTGKLGLACPATPSWSPWFGRIISKVTENREIKPTFYHWKNPWFHLPTENDYKLFFEKHGFVTIFIDIDHEQTDYSAEEAFNNSVKEEIKRQSRDGRIMVDFNRLYYIGRK